MNIEMQEHQTYSLGRNYSDINGIYEHQLCFEREPCEETHSNHMKRKAPTYILLMAILSIICPPAGVLGLFLGRKIRILNKNRKFSSAWRYSHVTFFLAETVLIYLIISLLLCYVYGLVAIKSKVIIQAQPSLSTKSVNHEKEDYNRFIAESRISNNMRFFSRRRGLSAMYLQKWYKEKMTEMPASSYG